MTTIESDKAGLHLTCSHMNWASDLRSVPQDIAFEALPGEKWAVICQSESMRHRASLVLAGLEDPPEGVVRYNDVDLRSLPSKEINAQRSIVLGWDLTLFEGSIADNITMERAGVKTEDVLWALRAVQLDRELEQLPEGLETLVQFGGKEFTPNQRLRILLARAIIYSSAPLNLGWRYA